MDLLHAAQPYLPLTLLVFLAGFVDAIAGGGGLITLPAYLAHGLPPALLLGTNKLSSSMGTLVAAVKFIRETRFKADFLFIMVFLAALGALLGARTITLVPPEMIRYLLLVTLPPAAIFLVSQRAFGLVDTSAAFTPNALLARAGLISFFISFYDGLLGPGTGTFLALAFARVCRFDLLRSTALAKVLNLTSNIASLAAFLYFGRVNIALGLAMGAAGMAGNYAGSHLALKKGTWVIRPMLLLICAALLIKIVWDMLK
ncbi:MAG: hypothetical protein A2234_00400 [Elusimicrobia bacterium RIFOXYA2_FULL_58_8]|nr:MAG: hypothetical protein A2285_08585 [Elusimicrobia bacterium RIFOXYA12_FULL_57_11]OGS12737.1 MAG: hypothetical protein A2234_00400 [Elusimicrobia bacterium RIFOXYA2_FULL_58_8]